ncbi:hypothetical protein M407DRAFT_236814, partial [Tulasnella calospora MUT 4182]
SQTSLKKESDALQQILDSLAHLLINPSRLTFSGKYKPGFGPNSEVSLGMLDGSSKVLVKRLRLIQSSGALDMVRMATRFARALKTSAKANHPNIMRPIGYHLSSNYCIAQLVSPYMVNGNIKDYMLRDQTGIEVRLYFVRSIASGLAYLHSCDPPICHGALRPANVLINDEPDVVLCDFGLTTFVEDFYAESGIGTSQSLKGSINYMSPEIFQEVEPEHTLQSDVWAWACTAFEVRQSANILKFSFDKQSPLDPRSLLTTLHTPFKPKAAATFHPLRLPTTFLEGWNCWAASSLKAISHSTGAWRFCDLHSWTVGISIPMSDPSFLQFCGIFLHHLLQDHFYFNNRPLDESNEASR